MPKVSVIIPTYNRVDYLKEAIGGVLAQAFTDYEIIVIDDGSTDDTEEMVKNYMSTECKIRYLHQERKGVSVARNAGIDAAGGEWVAFLDSDDIWREDKLQLQMSFVKKYNDVECIFTDFSCFPPENKEYFIFKEYDNKKFKRFFSQAYWKVLSDCLYIQKKQLLPELLRSQAQIRLSSVMVKKSCLKGIRFDSELVMNEDIDFLIRVMLKCKVGYINRPLVRIRRHGECADIVAEKYDKTKSDLHFCGNLLKLLSSNEKLSAEETTAIRLVISRFYFDRGYYEYCKGNTRDAKKYYFDAVRCYFKISYLPGILKLCLPR